VKPFGVVDIKVTNINYGRVREKGGVCVVTQGEVLKKGRVIGGIGGAVEAAKNKGGRWQDHPQPKRIICRLHPG
jgi:hypothetical protein